MADSIRVQGIEFYGYHGCSEAEREVGHRYVVDLEIEADLAPAGRGDDLTQTVDYGRAVALVLQIGQGEPVNLMETLAERIAAALLDTFPAAQAARVAVSKRLPPVPAVVASAGVVIERRRLTPPLRSTPPHPPRPPSSRSGR